HAGVDERRAYFQVSRQAAEKIQGSPHKIEPRDALLSNSAQADGRVLIEADDGLVDQCQVRSASFADLHLIAAAIKIVQTRRYPLRLAGSTHLDNTLHGYHPCYPRIAWCRSGGEWRSCDVHQNRHCQPSIKLYCSEVLHRRITPPGPNAYL